MIVSVVALCTLPVLIELIRAIVELVLFHPDFDVLVFNGELRLSRLDSVEKSSLVTQVLYASTSIVVWLVSLILLFEGDSVSWSTLYVSAIMWVLVKHTAMRKQELAVTAVCAAFVLTVQTTFVTNAMIYTAFMTSSFIDISRSIFPNSSMLLRKSERAIQWMSVAFYFTFWPVSFFLFATDPSWIEAMIIPTYFYVDSKQLHEMLQSRKTRLE